MARQLTIDFSRAQQLAILRDCVLADRLVSGATVSGRLQKSVLRSIDDHGRGGVAWIGYERIAAEAGCSVRSAKRAVQALAEASLLIVETRRAACGVVCNHYVIVWTELDLLERVPAARRGPGRPPGPAAVAERSATVAERSATVAERSATVAIAECHGGTQTGQKAIQKRPEPPAPNPFWPAGGGEWQAIVSTWQPRIRQIGTVAAAAAEAGQSPAEFDAAVAAAWETATHPANAGKLHKPAGAVLYHMRTGGWPAEGVIAAEDTAAVAECAAAAAVARERAVARQRERSGLLAMAAIARLRKDGASDEAIRAELRVRWPPEVLAAIGW